IVDRHDYPETVDQLRSHGVKAVHFCADVSSEADVVRMVREAINELEGLDLFINNVAVHCDEPATKITAEGWENTLTTNLSACAYGCREVGRRFITQQSGSILIIGSTATYTLYPGEIAYRVTKSALVPYMEGLAAELAPFKIRVNMLTPGLFITRMTKDLAFEGELMNRVLGEIPWRRSGDALQELAPAALLLLSDRLSGYTTGANLVVDGGIKLRVLPWRTEDELRKMNQ
ncbi:MAG: SDR family oxidoreductase, partial [Pirellulales bacterium]